MPNPTPPPPTASHKSHKSLNNNKPTPVITLSSHQSSSSSSPSSPITPLTPPTFTTIMGNNNEDVGMDHHNNQLSPVNLHTNHMANSFLISVGHAASSSAPASMTLELFNNNNNNNNGGMVSSHRKLSQAPPPTTPTSSFASAITALGNNNNNNNNNNSSSTQFFNTSENTATMRHQHGGGVLTLPNAGASTGATPLLPTTSFPSSLSSFSPNPNYSTMTIVSVVVFYFVISISTVFMNKFVFSEESEFSFPYPLAATMFQLMVALTCILIMYPLNRRVSFLSFLPDLEFKMETAKSIFPLTVIFVSMLAFNNMCLNYVDVHLYQIARSLSICFTALFAKYIMGENNSWSVIISCGVVFVGYLIGAIGKVSDFSKVDVSILGLIYGLMSSMFVSLNSIYIKKKLNVVRNNQWILLIYNNTMSIVLMFLLSLVTGEMKQALSVPFLWNIKFWMIMISAGLCGFLINIAFFLQIKVTSPLTNTISGTAKACLQTILAFFVFKTPLEPMSLFGLVLSIVGFGLYSNYKRIENLQPKRT